MRTANLRDPGGRGNVGRRRAARPVDIATPGPDFSPDFHADPFI
jgi:hypothetical protein